MYHHVENTTFRIFTPVVLFHDATAAEYSSDNQLIRLKKQRVHAMLKTNVEFWSNVIQTTRQQQQQQQQQQPLEAPLSPLSVASSSSSFQSFHQIKPPQKQEDNDDESEEEEEEDIDELDEDDSMDESLQHHKKKPVNKPVTNNGRKRRGNLPKNVTAILKQWLIDHCRHPYPTEEEKRALRHKTNLTLNQISNWFINARRRILPLILAAPVYRQQSPSPPASTTAADSRTCYKKKMRRKRGWMASSDKATKQLCPPSSEML